MALTGTRLDSLPFEPVLTGPPLFPADAVFISPRFESFKRPIQVTEVFSVFDELAYFYGVFSCYAMVALIVFGKSIELLRRRHRRVACKVIRKAIKVLFKTFALLLDQESLLSRKWSIRIGWTFLNASILITVFCYWLSLLSTEQVAQFKRPEIHSLEDLLYKEDFRHFKPMIATASFTYSVIKEAKLNTKLGKLRKRIMKYPKDTLVHYNSSEDGNMDALLATVDDFRNKRDKTMILAGSIVFNMFRPIACVLDSSLISSTYVSNQGLAEGIISSVFSKSIERELLNYFSRRLRAYNEFHRGEDYILRKSHSMLREMGEKESSNSSIACEEGTIQTEHQNLHDIWLRLSSLATTYCLFCYGLLLATVVILLELKLFSCS